ncbi:hypothetical protein J7M22_04375 [Candidatus Poribacteria bacterium]|nr:hypothetical protein [Candidatus Poribacteria bacterium]
MQVMGEYAREQVRRKVSQFILSEAGRVGYRNAFSMAALVTASSLAAVLLSAQHSNADHVADCGDKRCQVPPFYFCCVGALGYHCSTQPMPGLQCWSI